MEQLKEKLIELHKDIVSNIISKNYEVSQKDLKSNSITIKVSGVRLTLGLLHKHKSVFSHSIFSNFMLINDFFKKGEKEKLYNELNNNFSDKDLEIMKLEKRLQELKGD